MDEKYMRQAIELARHGEGFVNPNPLVGAVIVKNGRVIGTGYHARYGELHAERHALSRLSESADGADLYVTLEPCCHYGKQPPCTEAIAAAGIKNVYVGSRDPNPLVSGKGNGYLREHGINVYEDVLRDECDRLNPIFFTYITQKRPYIILKAAMTLDGHTAAANGDAKWISGEESRRHCHGTRKRVAAILVGINTVLADDPMLNCRIENPSNPIRIVCDSNLRIPLNSKVVKTAREIPLIVAAARHDESKERALVDAGADVVVTEGERTDIPKLMKILAERGVDSVLVEGGAAIHASMLKAGFCDKLQLYIAPKIIGGMRSKPVVGETGIEYIRDAYMFKNQSVTRLGDDILLEYERAV